MQSSSLLRAKVSQFLESRPVPTKMGTVLPETRRCEFGFPGGSHTPTNCWVYGRTGTGLEMLFSFFNNFTPNDLLTKIVEAGATPMVGEGATLQFNADRCFRILSNNDIEVSHHGQVTVSRKVARRDLVAAINKGTPNAWSALQQKISQQTDWPLLLGMAEWRLLPRS